MDDGALDFLPEVFVRLFLDGQEHSGSLGDGFQFLDQPLASLAAAEMSIGLEVFSSTDSIGHLRLKLSAHSFVIFRRKGIDGELDWFAGGVQGVTSALSLVLRASRSFMRALWS